jgi:hypothetical protein
MLYKVGDMLCRVSENCEEVVKVNTLQCPCSWECACPRRRLDWGRKHETRAVGTLYG